MNEISPELEEDSFFELLNAEIVTVELFLTVDVCVFVVVVEESGYSSAEEAERVPTLVELFDQHLFLVSYSLESREDVALNEASEFFLELLSYEVLVLVVEDHLED